MICIAIELIKGRALGQARSRAVNFMGNQVTHSDYLASKKEYSVRVQTSITIHFHTSLSTISTLHPYAIVSILSDIPHPRQCLIS